MSQGHVIFTIPNRNSRAYPPKLVLWDSQLGDYLTNFWLPNKNLKDSSLMLSLPWSQYSIHSKSYWPFVLNISGRCPFLSISTCPTYPELHSGFLTGWIHTWPWPACSQQYNQNDSWKANLIMHWPCINLSVFPSPSESTLHAVMPASFSSWVPLTAQSPQPYALAILNYLLFPPKVTFFCLQVFEHNVFFF